MRDRVAVVTGASRGIGAAIAGALVTAGARVHGLSRTGEAPAGVQCHVCDLTEREDIATTIERVGGKEDRVDILINAAGASFPASSNDATNEIDRFERTLAVDLTSAYACVLAAVPFMRQAAGATILNITSINSVRGFPGNPGYVAAKAGLAGLTRALAVDLAPQIRVNALAPGYVHTQMTRSSFENPDLYEERRRHTVLGRWGSVDDIVGAALFLVSPASAYVTGQELFVDGGWTVQGLIKG